jgi:uncharacterized damage-inducible protein DinB
MEIREQLRNEIEDTWTAFHQLLDSLPDETFTLPSGNPAWTIGEVLYHMSLAPRFLISDVRIITGQSWITRLLPVLMPTRLFNWLNKVLTRYGARQLSRQFLAQEYDRAHTSTLQALDSVSDDDFSLRVFYPDWDPLLSGEVTLERLFHYVKNHFDAHAAQINQVIKHKP